MKSQKKHSGEIEAQVDFNSREAIERFREAATVFNDRVNRSKETARRTLISEGIYTKTGRLSKNYR